MPDTIQYGIFGSRFVERDDDGFIEVGVIVDESGLHVGAPPYELRIQEVIGAWSDTEKIEFAREWVKKENAKGDLPSYVAKAKIKVYDLEF